MKPLDQNTLISSIFKNVLLAPGHVDLLAAALERVAIKKGQVLLEVGQQVTDQYFVSSGCLRSYFQDEMGKEFTLMIAIKDWWISDYTAYFTTSPSIVTIDCIQEATVYKLPKKELDNLYSKVPPLESFFRKKMEGAFASFQKRILTNISQPAKERYITFINTYPTIEKRVKNYHIASYLGITTESLSRIRKEIAKV